MSTLFIEALEDGVSIATNIRITEDKIVSIIRPHIFRQGLLSNGELELSILEGASVLATQTIDYTRLNDLTTQQYWHGFVSFNMETILNHVQENDYTEYTLRLTMRNYTPTTDRMWLVTDLEGSTVPTHGTENFSRGFELYTYRF